MSEDVVSDDGGRPVGVGGAAQSLEVGPDRGVGRLVRIVDIRHVDSVICAELVDAGSGDLLISSWLSFILETVKKRGYTLVGDLRG